MAQVMAQVMAQYKAELLDVPPASNPPQENWCWRLQYVGLTGILAILQSEHKHPGELFLRFDGIDGRFLKTSCGRMKNRGGELRFTTKQSVYIFKVTT
jgi:hypothetical protein